MSDTLLQQWQDANPDATVVPITDTYNGWANYETWNVALYIQNEFPMYEMARMFRHHGYKALSHMLEESFGSVTPDGVYWKHADLDIDELNEMLSEL